ncbi:MAG: FUSC family protein [Myxococcales bacterium]|nr:FUSC family protein [Myxococcales bacterium]
MRLRNLFEMGTARPDYVAGLRAATATIVPLAIGEATGRPQLIWAALGGWLGTFADPGGPYPLRATTLLSYVLASAASVVAGTVAASRPWAAIAILFFWAAGCALLKVYGEAAGTVGSLALITFCIALGTPVPDLRSLELRTLLFAAGALWASGLALALWPVHPWRPVRRAIAACHRALADHTRHLATPGSGWFDAASKERGAIRALLENARSVIALVRGERSGDSRRAELLTVLYESAELCLGDLSALAETLQSLEERGERKPPLPLEDVARTFDRVADATSEESADAAGLPEDLPGLEVLASHLALAVGAANALHGHGEAMASHIRIESPMLRPSAFARRRQSLLLPARRSLKDALSFRSLDLRHAIRVGLTAAAAALLGLLLHRDRRYWIIVTAVIVLQPHSGATLRKGLQRIAGTVAGAIAATLLAPFFHGHLQTAALLFVLALFGAAARHLNYAVYIALITPLFVLLAESTSGDWHLIPLRITATLLGGTVAILGSYTFPHRERERLPSLLAAAVRQTKKLLETPSAEIRREVGLLLTNADSAFERFLDEGPTSSEVEAVMAIRSQLRRLVGAILSLSPEGRIRPELSDAARQIGQALAQMERASCCSLRKANR